MPNIAAILKSEISRVARKSLRGETDTLKKATRTCRSDVAALKRRTHDLEQQVRRLSKIVDSTSPPADVRSTEGLGFNPKGLISQRKRLGLSAAECGLLVGASPQSIYNW